MLNQLCGYYESKGIGATSFSCPWRLHCSSCPRSSRPKFTSAQGSRVGPEYERGTVPRLLFLSLDSGSAEADRTHKTLEALRRREMARDVDALPKGNHWYLTHEMAFVLLRALVPGLAVDRTSPYFAHVNSAKCCLNNPGRKQADDGCSRTAVSSSPTRSTS